MLKSVQAMSLVMIIVFLSYLASIVWSYFCRKQAVCGDVDEFDWHFFVPCRDEATVVESTIERLRDDFPNANVWVIDDDSDDDTARIAGAWAERDPLVHVVRRIRPFARTGKGNALNAAYRELNLFLPRYVDRAWSIVCVVDADGHLAPDALGHVCGPAVFGDPRVGAAQISVRMRNRNERTPRPDRGRLANAFSRYLVRMQDIEFRTTIAAMQTLRVRTRSVGLGGNGQFTRLSVLDDIAQTAGSPWHGGLLEDYELGVHVLLAGYENRYVDETYVSQEGVTDFGRLITQRTRWSQGNIQCVKYLPDIVRSRHFTSAAVIEAAYYLLLPFVQLIGVVIWPAVIGSALLNTTAGITDLGGWLANAWWYLALVFLFGIVPFAMWGPIYRAKCEPDAPLWRSLLWGLGMCVYVEYMYISVTRAFVRIMLGRSGWAKTRRNAENLTIGVLAKEA